MRLNLGGALLLEARLRASLWVSLRYKLGNGPWERLVNSLRYGLWFNLFLAMGR